MTDRWERKLNEKKNDSAGWWETGPDRKQTARSSGVTEDSLGKEHLPSREQGWGEA